MTRFDIVPDPEHRELLEDRQRKGAALAFVKGEPLNPVAFQDWPEESADLVKEPRQRVVGQFEISASSFL